MMHDILLNPMLLVPSGLLFAFIGACLVADVPTTLSRVSFIERLPPVAVAVPGQAVFVDGHVSQRTLAIHHQFVAYLREEYRSCGRRSCWVEVARKTPPLLVESHGRVVQIINDNYHLDFLLAGADVSIEERQPTLVTGSVRSRGVVVGSPVLAVGVAAPAMQGLEAEFLYAGTRAEYVAALRASLKRAGWWGGAFVLCGTGCIMLGLWQWRKFMRQIKAGN